MPSMKFNPFAENKAPSRSMFAKERPAVTPTDSEVKLEDQDVKYSVQEYLGVKMSLETKMFFNELASQVGENSAKEVVSSRNTSINDSGDLITLYCGMTRELTILPELPSKLRVLNCGFNIQLTSLPELPAGLTELSCSHSKIASLPELPKGLRLLSCGNTLISSLPELPGKLDELHCSNTQISSLPELPSTLKELDCSGTPFSNNPEAIAELEVKYPGLRIYS